MEAVKHIHEDTVIISASKGIEQERLLTVSAIINEITAARGRSSQDRVFAREVIDKRPTAVTLAAKNQDIALLLQEVFNTDYFRVYTHSDVLGVELGGGFEKRYRHSLRICDGMGLGHSARAALITRGLSEITRLGESMGADKRTFSGLSGLGDLVLTCTGPLSRNYSVGVKLGQGQKLSGILSATKSIAEGVATASSAYGLSIKMGVEMPIVEQVYEVIYKEKNPADAVSTLLSRTLRSEF